MEMQEYENSFDKYSFKECLVENYGKLKTKNQYHYDTVINKWYKQRCKELSDNNKLKEHFVLLNNYLIDIKQLFVSVIELYQAIERYDNIKVRLNKVNLKQYDVIKQFEHLQEINIVVREYINKGFESLGKKIKDYILLKLDEMIFILKNTFYIDILKSRLKTICKKTFKVIKNSTKQIEHTKNIPDEDYQEYFEITKLFAQGFIKQYDGENCSFKDKKFKTYLDLEKYLKENVIPKNEKGKKINIRQYLRHTLTNYKGVENNKNLYFKLSIMNRTYQYCKRKNINMTEGFKRIRIELNN